MKKLFLFLLALLLLSCGNKNAKNQTNEETCVESSIDTTSDTGTDIDAVSDNNEPDPILSTAKNNPIDPVKGLYIYNKISDNIELLERWEKNTVKYFTKRFNAYRSAYTVVGMDMIGGEGYVDNPIVQPVEGQDYIFKVSFTSCGEKKNLYFLVALEDQEWKVDNLLKKESPNRWRATIDYSQSLKNAWMEHYDYPGAEEIVSKLSQKEIADSKSTPQFVPVLNE